MFKILLELTKALFLSLLSLILRNLLNFLQEILQGKTFG